MVEAIDRPEREQYMLVTIKYGDSSVKFYTDWDRNIGQFLPTPEMGILIPENTGTFEQKEARVLLPDTLEPAATLLDGLHPQWPVFMKVQEVTAGLFPGDQGLQRTVFNGQATRSVTNLQGRENIVGIFFLPQKGRMAEIKMGLPCNHHCANQLFGPGCELSVALRQKLGEIASLDGAEVTIVEPNTDITAPTSPGGRVDRYWERGYLERDNLRVPVHIWEDTAPTKFVMRRRPPADWVLAGSTSIKFVPGCHKTLEDCKEVWDNEQGEGDSQGKGGFAGYGFAIPPYNPLYENPQGR